MHWNLDARPLIPKTLHGVLYMAENCYGITLSENSEKSQFVTMKQGALPRIIFADLPVWLRYVNSVCSSESISCMSKSIAKTSKNWRIKVIAFRIAVTVVSVHQEHPNSQKKLLVIVHMIILRGSEDCSTDTARESGSEYTRMQTAMTKGSFQAWEDMQPTDFCLARQNPLITLHSSVSI